MKLKAPAASMEKVDRLGWPVGFSLEAYGVGIGVRSNDQAVIERLVETLPGAWKRAELREVDRLYSILSGGVNGNINARRFNHLYGDHVRLARSRDFESVLATLDSDFRLFVAEFAKRRVFVHAGAVGWKGRAIIIPGRSYSGKSTLVAELVRAGATYYSDEYAVIDPRGRLHPFAKPLELREEGSFSQSKIDISELGGSAGTKPLPIGLVLLTRFKEGARWRPRRLTAGKGVLELLLNTVSARREPQRAFETLEKVTAQAEVLKGPRGEAGRVVDAMLSRIERGFV